jgi:hypothetical protein
MTKTEKVQSILEDLKALRESFPRERVACLQISTAERQLRYVLNDLICEEVGKENRKKMKITKDNELLQVDLEGLTVGEINDA